MTQKYCSAVDTGLFVNVNGSVKLCCSGSQNLGSLREKPISEIFENPLYFEIKSKLDSNLTHAYCEGCDKIESTAPGSSQRSAFNDTFNNTQERRLGLIDIRWSNVCNLSCRYCNTEDSSEWRRLHNLPIERVDKDYTESLFKEISANRDSIDNVYLLGGEPLLQKHNIRLLDLIKPTVKIDLLTNLAVKLENNKIYQELRKFRTVLWNLSFDNIGERFEYVRAGADWSVFESNLERICNDFGPHRVTFHPVYTIWNATCLEEYYEFASKRNMRVNWQIALPKVDNHGLETDSFTVFGHKPKVIERAIKEIEKLKINDASLLGIKNSLINSIETANKSKEFLTWTAKMEAFMPPRKHFNILWPELNTLLSEIN